MFMSGGFRPTEKRRFSVLMVNAEAGGVIAVWIPKDDLVHQLRATKGDEWKRGSVSETHGHSSTPDIGINNLGYTCVRWCTPNKTESIVGEKDKNGDLKLGDSMDPKSFVYNGESACFGVESSCVSGH